jgi:N utilization substance protein B
MTDRRRARILAMQALCQLDVQGDETRDLVETFFTEQEASPAAKDYARRLFEIITEKRTTYDDRLRKAAEHWALERMPLVDRNVLRVAVCELLDRPDVPAAVVIDEAIEIAREFGSEDSGAFVNGVLDAIRKCTTRGL